MRKVFSRVSWALGFLTLALLIVGILSAPTQALADGGDSALGNPPCSSCYNGCRGQVVPTCSDTYLGCVPQDMLDCGPTGSNCICRDGGQPMGSPCSCL
jgi:hypothetical protein